MKLMLEIVNYVEAHLHDDLSVTDVALHSGYSSHHFQKLFAAVTGLSLGSYIRRRRLTVAANILKNSSERIIDIALNSGFESQEAFTVSFKKTFGLNPNEFRKSNSDCGLKKLESYTADMIRHLTNGGIDMQPQYESRNKFYVMGLGKIFERDNTTDIGELLWPTLIKRLDEIPNKTGQENITYGVCQEIWKEENIQDQFNYYAGVEVEQNTPPPNGMELLEISSQNYAVFIHRGGIKDLKLTNQYIWGTWFPQSGHKLVKAADLEVYPANFCPDDPNGEMEIWVPIEG